MQCDELMGAESAVRPAYGLGQAELVRALVGRAPIPVGFDAAQVSTLSTALVRKRGRAVARAWPALARSLGPSFGDRFTHYAHRNPPPVDADAVADGLAFARLLPTTDCLDEAANAELLRARARHVSRGGRTHRRRLPFMGVARVPDGRLLVVINVPGLGTWGSTLRLTRREAASDPVRRCFSASSRSARLVRRSRS